MKNLLQEVTIFQAIQLDYGVHIDQLGEVQFNWRSKA
jgi:hypothetical protein